MSKRLKLKGGFRETKEDYASRVRGKKLVIKRPKRRSPAKKK
jgi:hypothetical protein